jgi:HEAT repeat protein
METRNSALIVALYILGAVLVAGICFTYYSYERSFSRTQLAEDSDSNTTPAFNRRYQPSYSAALVKANKAVRDLEASLSTSQTLIEARTSALNQKTSECKVLREQLDHALALLHNLLDEDEPGSREIDRTSGVRVKLETEFSQLQESLDKPNTTTTENADSLVQLQSELIQADLHLAALEQQSQRDLQLLTTEKQSVEQTSSEVIARCGVMAMPLLIELLSDERVEIRRWSAKALGAIGPDARDALPALRELVGDPDPTVRSEVTRAIAKMD